METPFWTNALMVLLELGSAPGPGREARTPETGSHLAGGRDRLKRVGGWDRRDDLLVVPRRRDLVLALDLGQVDVVDDSVIGSDLPVAQEDVVDLLAVELLPHRSEEHTSELQSRQYLVCR